MSYPPAYLLQGAAVFMVGVASLLVWGAMSTFWANVDLLQRSFLVSDYLFGVLWMGATLFVAQCLLGIFARKIMIVGDSVWIKSLGYRATIIELDEIDSVEIHSPFAILISPKLLKEVKYRFFYYDACFWRRGVLIRSKRGVSYFIGATDAVDAACELVSYLQRERASVRVPVRALAPVTLRNVA
jgi:hypothetical protein